MPIRSAMFRTIVLAILIAGLLPHAAAAQNATGEEAVPLDPPVSGNAAAAAAGPAAPKAQPPSGAFTTPTHSAAERDALKPGEPAAQHELADNAEMLIGKPLVTRDGEEVGRVVDISRDATGQVTAIHVEMGGVMGFLGDRVALKPTEIAPGRDKAVAALTRDELDRKQSNPD
ncbi:PRC-barrel domain-containing protein [Segnochrobactrum spirostomi]|uniref:PRC-barrel domain containing protein n=1 Tax=Segnochrobactrum spirostomi TaxID=2608987 RepID=A0A6A7Y1Q7_9HYPH|nr:PRC-barrel domain-containing protein [Segnochrobactrum spirostomi]MQT12944.1 PRC-barrel domain containing protein [Segnochrobactrum spirostomi]